MRSAWRSSFWNVVLMVIMAGIAAIVTSVALSQTHAAAVVGFGVIALLCWIGAVRALTLGVVAKPHGVVVREFMRTRTIDWAEIDRIEVATDDGGTALDGPTAPVIVRRRPDGTESVVELNSLGGYGLFRQQSSPGCRVVADLNAHLRNWRNTTRGRR